MYYKDTGLCVCTWKYSSLSATTLLATTLVIIGDHIMNSHHKCYTTHTFPAHPRILLWCHSHCIIQLPHARVYGLCFDHMYWSANT